MNNTLKHQRAMEEYLFARNVQSLWQNDMSLKHMAQLIIDGLENKDAAVDLATYIVEIASK